ncbi:MAG: MFS transporter [Gammaproteobacteria bacterium]|nr:MFS transporter [Gammaproteobacteria bacterium]
MKKLGVLWLVVFISLTGFGITTIPFPFVAEVLGASDFWKTFGGSGVFSLFQLIATPIWGRFSDAYGRKPILVLSTAGTILSFVWLAYASTLESLLVARAFGGIMSGNLAAAFAYTTDVTDASDRAKGLGIVASAFGVGFAVGPVIGGFLGTIDGVPSMYWPALASAALSAFAFVGTLFFLPESLPADLRKPFVRKGERVGEAVAPGEVACSNAVTAPAVRRSPLEVLRSRPVLLGLVSASLFIAIASGVMQSVFQFWGRDLFNYSLRDIGVHFMVFALLSAVGQAGLVGPLAKRFGEKNLAITAGIGVTAGLVLFATAQNDTMVWMAICIFGLANGLFLPAITSLVSFEADARSRGTVMGVFNASSSAGRIVGPALSGPIYFKLGPAAPFLMSAALAVLGVLLLSRVSAKVS